MVHEVFDVERWKREFSLAKLRAKAREYVLERQKQHPLDYPDQKAVEDHVRLMEPKGDTITGPCEMAVMEQLREMLATSATSEKLGTDVFVFCRGEAPRREMTKVGGLPYLPRRTSWPRSPSDVPMTFVAQFCFADSRDIVGDLPGEVLLVFATEHDAVLSCEEDAVHFEWVNIGSHDLVSSPEVPRTDWEIAACYGVCHRSWDWNIGDALREQNSLRDSVAIHHGTKIGGLAPWIQSPEELPGRFLCSLGSIHPRREEPYPFLNVPAPIGWDAEYLMLGDVGTLYVFLGPETLHWTVQCY